MTSQEGESRLPGFTQIQLTDAEGQCEFSRGLPIQIRIKGVRRTSKCQEVQHSIITAPVPWDRLHSGEQRRSESWSTKDDHVEESVLPVGNSAKKLRINAPGLQDDVRDAVSPSSSVLHQELKQSVDAAQRELGNSTTRSEWTQRGTRGIFTTREPASTE